MRHKGRLSEWNDARGFGFATPVGGGDRVFIHIKAFGNRLRRPAIGEIVVYDLVRDAQGRPQGANVTFSGTRAPQPSTPRPGAGSLIFAAVFLAFVAGTALTGLLPWFALAVYGAASAITYVVYAWDKSAAENDRRRVPESTLQLWSLFGGWPGALLAQKTLRHKSRKQSFQVVFRAAVVVNCAAFVAILWAANQPPRPFSATLVLHLARTAAS
jgi:uncharacterized membrane protein YsdA (DUF1294 family)/cold shock CspA family protein